MGYISRLSAILYLPSFRWFWLGSSIQSVAQATQFLAIGWLVLEVTGSSAQLGLVIFLYGVPNVAFLLLAGVAADRFDRCLLYTSPSPRDGLLSRMPSSA